MNPEMLRNESKPNHPTNAVTGQPPLRQRKTRRVVISSHTMLRGCVWAYFALLIFEGALRKWFLPGLATPLLVIRDPLAIAALFLALREGLMPINSYVSLVAVVGVLSTVAAVTVGHGSAPVAAFGARTMLIHFPFAFVIGKSFDRSDVERMGQWVLMISVAMVILTTLQFYSPQSAWVNRGVGGDMEGAGFDGAMGYSRPPGTFSFTNGLTLFFGLVAAYAFYFWLEPKGVRRWVLFAATGSLLMAVPLSISRTLLFEVLLTLMFTFVVIVRKPRFLKMLMPALLGCVVIAGVLSMTPAFNTAIEVLSTRFESASEAEGGLEGTLVDRFLGGLLVSIGGSTDKPIFGYGLGLGTNVGAKLATGEVQFMLAEAEWGRTIGEIGPLFGLLIVFARILLSLQLLWSATKRLGHGDPLPWMLMSFAFLIIAQGGWAQPTALGFFALTLGLVLASFRSVFVRSASFCGDSLQRDPERFESDAGNGVIESAQCDPETLRRRALRVNGGVACV